MLKLEVQHLLKRNKLRTGLFGISKYKRFTLSFRYFSLFCLVLLLFQNCFHFLGVKLFSIILFAKLTFLCFFIGFVLFLSCNIVKKACNKTNRLHWFLGVHDLSAFHVENPMSTLDKVILIWCAWIFWICEHPRGEFVLGWVCFASILYQLDDIRANHYLSRWERSLASYFIRDALSFCHLQSKAFVS